MAELRVTSTGTIKLFESDDTSSVTIASPASLGGDRTITLPDANVDLTEVNTMPIANLDIDGGTDIGAAITDSDLFIIDDGAGGTNRKTAASRIKTYVGGFDVSSITGATELATQPAATDEIVLSDAGTLKRLDIKHIQNTPAFQAFNSSTQTISNTTYTTLAMGSELFDTDSAYDTSNYRFTPGVAGKYYLYATTRSANNNSYPNSIIKIKKNGSDILFTNIKNEEKESVKVFGIVDSDADDYFHVEYYHDKGGDIDLESGNTKTYFGGFRIAGV